MSNNNKTQKDSTLENIALLGATGMGGGGTSQDMLATLLANKFRKEAAIEAEEEAQKEAFRSATIAGVTKMMAARAAAQAQCPHMKPNFRPATGGQRDHNGNHHFLCQYCGKEFGNDLPGYLRISADMIGGPQ